MRTRVRFSESIADKFGFAIRGVRCPERILLDAKIRRPFNRY